MTTIDLVLPTLLLDAAATTPPAVARRLSESCEVIARHVSSAIIAAGNATFASSSNATGGAAARFRNSGGNNNIKSSGGGITNTNNNNSAASLCLMTLASSPQIIEGAIRDCLLQHLATCFTRGSEDDVASVAAVAHNIFERLLAHCARNVPGVSGSLADLKQSARRQNDSTVDDRRRSRNDDFNDDDDDESQQEHQQQHERNAVNTRKSAIAVGLHRAVSLGCAKLDKMLNTRHRGFLRGQVHELFGEAGCGKSTWTAQLMLHTLRTVQGAVENRPGEPAEQQPQQRDETSSFNSNNDDNTQIPQQQPPQQKAQEQPQQQPSVLLLSAEPVSMARIEQVARAEFMQMRLQQQKNGTINNSNSNDWRALLSGFLIVELRHVEHFEETVRMMLQRFTRSGADVPLVVLDSVAALVEKSLKGANAGRPSAAASSTSSGVVSDIVALDRPSDPIEKAQFIERVGTALRLVAWRLNSAVVVVNQARWSGGAQSTAISTGESAAAENSNNSNYAGGNNSNNSHIQPALGFAWSSFVTGCSVELSRPQRGAAPAARRRARVVRSSTNPPSAVFEFDLVAGGVADAM